MNAAVLAFYCSVFWLSSWLSIKLLAHTHAIAVLKTSWRRIWVASQSRAE